MDAGRKERLRRYARGAYFGLLFALAAIVTWDATVGAHHSASSSAASVEQPGRMEETLADGSPPKNGAKALTCETRTHVSTVGDLPEASGLALSRRTPDVLWSMNDSDDPVVVALSLTGTTKGRVRVAGAMVKDWEDVSVGPCANGSCLYVADIGDIHGDAKRKQVTIYRTPEPAPGDAVTANADVFTFDYPDKGHDAEAVFIGPGSQIFVVTKGHPTQLYAAPRDAKAGTPAMLAHLADLPIERFLDENDRKRTRITDAETSPDGKWVALRTNAELLLYRSVDLSAGRSGTVWHADLRPLDETQGEGVALSNDGDVYLAGEGGGHGLPGTFAHIKCQLPSS